MNKQKLKEIEYHFLAIWHETHTLQSVTGAIVNDLIFDAQILIEFGGEKYEKCKTCQSIYNILKGEMRYDG